MPHLAYHATPETVLSAETQLLLAFVLEVVNAGRPPEQAVTREDFNRFARQYRRGHQPPGEERH